MQDPGSLQHGKTPLHYSCMNGNMKIVQALLAKGADPGKTDKAGRTPIDEASDNEYGPFRVIADGFFYILHGSWMRMHFIAQLCPDSEFMMSFGAVR